jgi:hypothetical protein
MARGKIAAGLMCALVLGLGGASAAYAKSASTAGAEAWDSGSRQTINSKDTADDGKWVTAGWKSNRGSENAVKNEKGNGGVVSKKVTSGSEVISSVRACRSNSLRPMTCSGWNSY